MKITNDIRCICGGCGLFSPNIPQSTLFKVGYRNAGMRSSLDWPVDRGYCPMYDTQLDSVSKQRLGQFS
jgi:hypothetical protein